MILPALIALSTLGGSASDLSPESDVWNGMSYLWTTAQEANVAIEAVDTYDWSQTNQDDILLFLDPVSGPADSELVQFLRDGGHAIIAVDNGHRAEPLLTRLGLDARTESIVHDEFYEDHPAFPRIVPPPDGQRHFLWFNVEDIVANHPTVLRFLPTRATEIVPMVSYSGKGAHLVAEAQVGRGYALVLGDTSLFINDMQKHLYGDKQLVANVLRYYCDSSETCRISLVLPGATLVGQWESRLPEGLAGLRYLFDRGVDALTDLVVAISTTLARPVPMLIVIACLLLMGALSTLLLPWPGRRPRFAWLPPSLGRVSMNEYWVAALSRRRTEASFIRPATVLLRDLEARLERSLPAGTLVALDAESRTRIATSLESLTGQPIARPALRCLDALNKVRASRPADPVPHVGLKEFEDLWKNCETVTRALETRR